MSVRPNGKTRLPLGFSSTVIFEGFFFRKSDEKIKIWVKSAINSTLHEELCTSTMAFSSFLLTVENVADKH